MKSEYLSKALAFAEESPSSETWTKIATLAGFLKANEIVELDETLNNWPDQLRIALPHWCVPASKRAKEFSCPPSLQICRGIWLENRELTSRNLSDLVTSPYVKKIVLLHLHNNQFTEQATETLSAKNNLQSLEELFLGGHNITDKGMKLLAKSKALGSLLTLNLYGNALSDEGIEHLASSAQMKQLNQLLFFERPNTFAISPCSKRP
jgi:hypothetical protein